MIRFITEHKDHQVAGPDGGAGLRWGVEPMCAVLSEHGVPISASTYYEWITKTPRAGSCATPSWSRSSLPSARTGRTGKFVQTLGSRKMWIWLRGQGHDVARCTVERIMREKGWEGARYGSKHKTTIADDSHSRYPDLVDRQLLCTGAKSIVGGRLYLCADLDGVRLRGVRHRRVQPPDRRLASRTIDDHRPGPRRRRACLLHPRPGRPHQTCTGLIAHSDAGSSIHLGGVHPTLIDEGVDPSVGSVGDALDNALAETTVGSFKNELIRRQGPWRDVNQVELAHRRMGDVVQHRTPARVPRRLHPRGRRETPLRSQTHPTKGRVIQQKQSPDSPGRVSSRRERASVKPVCELLDDVRDQPSACGRSLWGRPRQRVPRTGLPNIALNNILARS